MVHSLEGEDTFDMGEATDRRQPIQHRVSPVKSVSMVHSLEGEDTFDMGEATDRRQPLHYRVSPLRASQWCTLEGEDTFDMGDGSTDRRQPLHYRVSHYANNIALFQDEIEIVYNDITSQVPIEGKIISVHDVFEIIRIILLIMIIISLQI